MVSPLKTWHHHEPKGLWPTLGGLALLTHVGILGLSLPYVLKLVQPTGDATENSIPITLVDVAPETVATAPATNTQAASKAPEQTTQETAQAPLSQSAADNRPARSQASEPKDSSDASTDTLTAPSSSTSVTPAQQQRAEANQPPEETTAETNTEENAGEDLEPSDPVGDSPSNSETSDTPSDDSPSSETDSPSSENSGQTADTEPATLPSDGPELPPPSASEGTRDRNQVAYLTLVSHSHIPDDSDLLTDLADSPATPIYEASNGIVLEPQTVGCGTVNFSRSPVTYRVEVSPQGTLRDAVPWTGSIAPYSMNEEEKAISCLIVSADFQFSPATKDGAPVANSNLILTIDIIESKPD